MLQRMLFIAEVVLLKRNINTAKELITIAEQYNIRAMYAVQCESIRIYLTDR